MSREVHVRFWESVEVRFLRATRLRLPTAPPPLASARDPEEQLDLAFNDPADVEDLAYRASPRSRAPPSNGPPSSHDRTIDFDHDWGA